MTRARLMRRVAYVFFAAYAVFVTFPAVLPFRGPRPFILGMPLPMVWVSSWVVGGAIVLWLLDRAYAADERDRDRVQDAGEEA